jgi:hypothetical protein
VALRPLRQHLAEMAVASSSRITSPSMSAAAGRQRYISTNASTYLASSKRIAPSQRYLCTSSSRARPPSPEPAISRPLDTPPGPIAPPGEIKSNPPSPQAVNHTFAPEKDEACSTLSPSSPSAPRTQSNSAVDKGKAREVQSSAFSSNASEEPRAIAPEILNKPSVGRKGSGKAFKAQKAALTLVSLLIRV